MQWFDFYKGKKVFITGHTGFKGSWMAKVLLEAGAELTGYALNPPTEPNLFKICNLSQDVNSIEGDIRDLRHLQSALNDARPEVVIHMAAQPIVRDSYKNPVYTYETNVMGTVNILEGVRNTDTVRSVINVTTDKVYKNKEWYWGYREDEELNGYDPYSNSKSCSELVTASYKSSFLDEAGVAVSTVRAGNVIGGGDFAVDRIIPDCVRAVEEGKDIIVRNPYSVRPYEHVLEPVVVYLMLAAMQCENAHLAGNYNVGPEEKDCLTTGALVDLFCQSWYKETGYEPKWINQYDGGPHEANFLKLDCSKLKSVLNWQQTWGIEQTMQKLVEWYHIYLSCDKINECMEKQIHDFLKS